ncbi:hypothetical protein ARMGADRAFT_589341 [Armillaria gallica]|uniref:Uncharacterized protein n=1 Tax=Armillaria gallica TaxID=47427 RepID=A0A2H3E4Z6_ARMGA|nr:hypothetical protein ARMGADRAFT_589341 [Armillaria gallica]
MAVSTMASVLSASTPPPSTPPASQAAPFRATLVPSSAAAPSTILMSSRLKVPHTTLECRYRTNFNARIQSLHTAVPALRVLEWNNGPKKNKGMKAKVRNEQDFAHIVDERGYVGGGSAATSLERPLSTFECLRSGRCGWSVNRMDRRHWFRGWLADRPSCGRKSGGEI